MLKCFFFQRIVILGACIVPPPQKKKKKIYIYIYIDASCVLYFDEVWYGSILPISFRISSQALVQFDSPYCQWRNHEEYGSMSRKTYSIIRKQTTIIPYVYLMGHTEHIVAKLTVTCNFRSWQVQPPERLLASFIHWLFTDTGIW